MQEDTKKKIKNMAYDYANLTGSDPEKMHMDFLNFFYRQPIYFRYPDPNELSEPLSNTLKKHFNSVRIMGKLYK